MKPVLGTPASPISEDEFWSLIRLYADYYWQEDSSFQCTQMRLSSDRQEGVNPLHTLLGSTLWDIGCLVSGRGQSWRQHLTDRKLQREFHELICKVPLPEDSDIPSLYISINGRPRYSPEGEFLGYHCLAREITEQMETENSLRRFRAAMDMSGDMIYLIDRKTLQYLDVNTTAWKNSGMTREALLKAGPLLASPQESRDALERRYDRLIIEGGTSRIEHQSMDAGGNPLYLETYSRASSIDGNWIIIAVTRNITRRKRMEETTQKLHQMYSSLSETNAASLRATSEEELYRSICDAALKGGKFAMACIFAPDNTGNLVAVASAGRQAENLPNVIVPLDASDTRAQGLIGSAYHGARACVSNDYLADPRTSYWHQLGEHDQVASAASFPLLCQGKAVSVLLFYAIEKDVFDEEIVKLLQSMADNVSFALENFSNERQRKNAEDILRENEERFRSLTHLSSDFFWEMDSQFRLQTYEGRIAGDSNTQAVAAIKGHTPWGFDSLACASLTWKEFEALLRSHERFKDIEFSFSNDEGVVYHLSINGEPVFTCDGKFQGYRGIARDITERRRISNRIQYLATHDNLTGLPNRTKFNELLENNSKLAQQHDGHTFALFFIDVDRFKKVNDSHGHHIGDVLLQEIARRLKHPLRTGDTVARLAGDEFVILLSPAKDRAELIPIADKVLKAFHGGVTVQGVFCDISVSIGISLFGQDAHDEETLLQHADAAMYLAKQQGKDNYCFYDEALVSAQAS
ncbi:MAG: diguanylate cyclase [Pseudomonadales bacterium]|nr:diguanylate cyclase [Pseudomonadales bacterium]MCP5331464.1 diguanylate cyclase [Pseudomonadales bacterium]MCP5343347.1 diguanylate cyclase [Pseudomonadales bacterium]